MPGSWPHGISIYGPIWEEERLIPQIQSSTGNVSCKLWTNKSSINLSNSNIIYPCVSSSLFGLWPYLVIDGVVEHQLDIWSNIIFFLVQLQENVRQDGQFPTALVSVPIQCSTVKSFHRGLVESIERSCTEDLHAHWLKLFSAVSLQNGLGSDQHCVSHWQGVD